MLNGSTPPLPYRLKVMDKFNDLVFTQSHQLTHNIPNILIIHTLIYFIVYSYYIII